MKGFGSGDDALGRVFRNSAWLFSAKGVGAVLSIFYLAILTRTLGPAGFGQFILIVSVIQILFTILHFETWQTVVHYGGPHLLSGNKSGFSEVAFVNIFIEMLGSLLTLVVIFVSMPLLASRFGWSPPVQTGVLIYTALVCFAMRSSAVGILRAHDRFKDGAMGDTVIPIVRLLGALALLLVGPDLVGFLIIWGLSELASALALWTLVIIRSSVTRKGIQRKMFSDVFSKEEGFFKFLVSTNLTYLLSIVRERLVVIIIGLYVSISAAGLFRLADQLANSVNRLTEIFARPLFAELSRLYAARQGTQLRKLYIQSLKIAAIAGGTMFGLLVLLGQPMIYAMSGGAFLGAYPMLVMLGAATIFGLVGLGLEPLLQAAGKAHLSLWIRIIGLAILTILLIILIPNYAAMGASAAMMISAAIVLILMLRWSWIEVRSLKHTKLD